MRYGYWLPIFGGWLRNVEDEGMPSTFEYAKNVIQQGEQLGFDTTLIAELYLNDIKGPEHDSLEAWTTAAGLAAVTETTEIMAAVRPNFHNPAITAKMASNIDHISGGRFTLNVVSAWWEEEAKQYGGAFTAHDERYDRTDEFLEIVKGLWAEENETYSYKGQFYEIEDTHLHPKPVQKPNPKLYAGGESPRGKQTIVDHCDAYVMHGGTVEEVKTKIDDMKRRREEAGKPPFQSFGMAAYVICRDTEQEAYDELNRITQVKESSAYAGYQDFTNKSQLEQQVKLLDYSVSNRGLRPELIGTPDQIADRILEFEEAGVDLLLLQCSPQLEEMERFSKQVMTLVEERRINKKELQT
ncbi:LLM class flavin-dependent oxidoreductase [Pontibacillus sp. HMF3514]|uniref:LLM class flavin-dependent oxidoreductase n=1 Tax=Pontibacillus sp. HMF3514 TaxID=2692425 RepID=UPI00131F7EDF|nr:LLM class flavin-dependent oxidoreductase [Pontibacillus sp. HMF3514]QHE53698.1 LLM class flavin-dependent oxidoreductase [Pontibacillus sp. HMF3514]